MLVSILFNGRLHMEYCKPLYVCCHCVCCVFIYTEARDIYNRTPLYDACVEGHIQVVRYLVKECKVDVGE